MNEVAPAIDLDLQGRRVLRKGDEVYLQRQQYELLLLFSDWRGRALTKRYLCEHLWPGHRYIGMPDDRSLQVQVSRLRRALPELKLVTLMHYGYRLD